ncbi:hypothetical protein BC829DRAFT_447066 [Chytridium lagenaria]|nr:hypothetical protein BC829DRAFT_447066 [Chytridium lagenaria]
MTNDIGSSKGKGITEKDSMEEFAFMGDSDSKKPLFRNAVDPWPPPAPAQQLPLPHAVTKHEKSHPTPHSTLDSTAVHVSYAANPSITEAVDGFVIERAGADPWPPPAPADQSSLPHPVFKDEKSLTTRQSNVNSTGVYVSSVSPSTSHAADEYLLKQTGADPWPPSADHHALLPNAIPERVPSPSPLSRENLVNAGRSQVVGYQLEREKILRATEEWLVDGKMRVVVVEGPSGGVKERFVDECITRIAQEDSLVPFSSITTAVQYITRAFLSNLKFEHAKQLPTSTVPSRPVTSLPPIALPGDHHIPSSTQSIEAEIVSLVNAETIGVYLIRMNEDPGLAPLLAGFFPWIRFEQTEFTKNLTPASRNKIMVSLIGRLLGDGRKFIKPLLSLMICSGSTRYLSKFCLYFLHQDPTPLKDVDFKATSSLANSAYFVHLLLTGLKPEDIRDYLTSSISENVTSVEDEVIKTILEKTETSPLVLELSVETLKEHHMFAVESGVLRFVRGKSSEIATLLENNVSQAIMMQFQRLQPTFQDFLRHACVLGQYINLADVRDILETRVAVERLDRLITLEDSFCYFKRQQRPGKKMKMYPYRREKFLHEKVGRLHEERMTERNRPSSLPLLYHHYMLTDNVEKRMLYAEELGSFKELNGDGIPLSFRNPERQAGWHASVALITSLEYNFREVFAFSKSALNLLGINLPEPEKATTRDILKRGLRHIELFISTRGGRKSLPARRRPSLQGALYANQALWRLYGATVEPSAWAMSSMMSSFLLLLSSKRISQIYCNAGLEAARKCTPEVLRGSFAAMSAVIASLSTTTFRQLEDFSIKFQESFERAGDYGQWQVARCLMFYVRLPKSSKDLKNLLLPRFEEIKEYHVTAAQYTCILLTRGAIIYKDLELLTKCEEELNALNERLSQTMGKPSKKGIAFASIDLWRAIMDQDSHAAINFLKELPGEFIKLEYINFSKV